MVKKEVIQVPSGNVQKLAKLFNITGATVYNALSGNTHSPLAHAIRKQAMDYYGGTITKKVYF